MDDAIGMKGCQTRNQSPSVGNAIQPGSFRCLRYGLTQRSARSERHGQESKAIRFHEVIDLTYVWMTSRTPKLKFRPNRASQPASVAFHPTNTLIAIAVFVARHTL